MAKPVIDQAKCNNCGTCIEICPMEVFAKQGNKTISAKPDDCIGCRACEVQCPKGAIKVVD